MGEDSTDYLCEGKPTCPAKGLLVNKGISSKTTKPSWERQDFLKWD